MKSVGLIVEYNPFHNGHAFHLQASKEAAEADVVIAVMSGNFLQRGEPALVSKWQRTKMALLNGVDIVFELPYRFATQKAETFANGAVSILDAVGCDSLCFGSESGDLSSFIQTIDYLKDQQNSFNENIRWHLDTGVSYPKALSLAFKQLPNANNYLDLAKPNNILGLEYIKAIQRQKSSVSPMTIPRKNADYHDEHFASATIASATSIRKAIFTDNASQAEINQYVPEQTKLLLKEYVQQFQGFHQWENYWSYLQFRLIHSSPSELREIYEMEEGLENRLQAASLVTDNFHKFMQQIKTKRYTWTRLQRLCVHILTNTKKEEMTRHSEKASYLRLLGMTSIGREYLNKKKSHLSLPLISKLASFKEKEINLDIKAARIYSLGIPSHLKNKMLRQEFEQPPIYIQEK
ncbi:nucleotidyltransferase [Bacillus sp. ISL-40]|uniref:nucleotidyltransferase n=1 Tax=unclassified Bacillus (in: firmicutes) TaxID=185979 RepID=UPI001BEB95BF|nr:MULTISPECIES: nucleotidyltransferase [unclassified Bacillus (in: firmicutes)]MBT2697716.1 nucleotidyltransferase [Bacillus sp. ISL-40]MBT2722541.1 nucleotidyltransferase [Bacillus sp. ISL-46]MBT2742356.1 nucleotidyltransferase [Bacillus sp. ISL-77]